MFETKGDTLRLWLRGPGRGPVKELTVTTENWVNGQLMKVPPLTEESLDCTFPLFIPEQSSRIIQGRSNSRLPNKLARGTTLSGHDTRKPSKICNSSGK